MSTEIPQIYSLIPKVMAEIGAIGKDRTNDAQKYKFRGIEDMYNAAHPALVNNGVFCCPQVIKSDSQERTALNSQGQQKTSMRVELTVCHKFYAPDGSCVDVITCGEGIDSSDKATNKAMSAAMKYAFIELFSIPTEDIADADRDSPEIGTKANGKPVPVTEKPISVKPGVNERIMPDAGDLITPAQATKLHLRFRDSLVERLKPQADEFLYDFLRVKMVFDQQGNPSALAIPKEQFATIGKAAVEFAKGLGESNGASVS